MTGFPHYSNYIILYYIILYYIRSYYIILYFNIVLYWIILHYFITIAYFVSSLLFYFHCFWFHFSKGIWSCVAFVVASHICVVLFCLSLLSLLLFFPRDLLNHNSRVKINRFILFFSFSFLFFYTKTRFKPYFTYLLYLFALIFYLDFRIHHRLHNVFGTF